MLLRAPLHSIPSQRAGSSATTAPRHHTRERATPAARRASQAGRIEDEVVLLGCMSRLLACWPLTAQGQLHPEAASVAIDVAERIFGACCASPSPPTAPAPLASPSSPSLSACAPRDGLRSCAQRAAVRADGRSGRHAAVDVRAACRCNALISGGRGMQRHRLASCPARRRRRTDPTAPQLPSSLVLSCAAAYTHVWPKGRPAVHACMLQLLEAFVAAAGRPPPRLVAVLLANTVRPVVDDAEGRAGPMMLLEEQVRVRRQAWIWPWSARCVQWQLNSKSSFCRPLAWSGRWSCLPATCPAVPPTPTPHRFNCKAPLSALLQLGTEPAPWMLCKHLWRALLLREGVPHGISADAAAGALAGQVEEENAKHRHTAVQQGVFEAMMREAIQAIQLLDVSYRPAVAPTGKCLSAAVPLRGLPVMAPDGTRMGILTVLLLHVQMAAQTCVKRLSPPKKPAESLWPRLR